MTFDIMNKRQNSVLRYVVKYQNLAYAALVEQVANLVWLQMAILIFLIFQSFLWIYMHMD